MNRYRHRFVAVCPANGIRVRYELTIWTDETVMAESIVEACSFPEPAFHEGIADALLHVLGGRQVLRAHHHGVDIKTLRG